MRTGPLTYNSAFELLQAQGYQPVPGSSRFENAEGQTGRIVENEGGRGDTWYVETEGGDYAENASPGRFADGFAEGQHDRAEGHIRQLCTTGTGERPPVVKRHDRDYYHGYKSAAEGATSEPAAYLAYRAKHRGMSGMAANSRKDESGPDAANVKRWMRNHVAEYVDHQTGEVNATKLAEEAAHDASRSEWLDDHTHPIWDWALEAAERHERSTGMHSKNPRGIYHDTSAQQDDYVIHPHHRGGFSVDRIGRGGTHTTIGPTSGYATMTAALKAAEADAFVHGVHSAVVFLQGADDMSQLGNITLRGTGRPKFEAGGGFWGDKAYEEAERIASGMAPNAHLSLDGNFSFGIGDEMKKNSGSSRVQPTGEQVASAETKYGRAFVTKEPDGLWYVWWPRGAHSGAVDWTYAFKTKKEAVAALPGHTANSGYTDCACRDCFDTAITSDGPALCGDCEEAGCDVDGGDECRREDAYEGNARGSKAWFGRGEGHWDYAIKIDGIENDFPLKPLGRQEEWPAVRAFQASARTDWVGAKHERSGGAAIKRWVKAVKPSQFYARYSEGDDSFQVWYTGGEFAENAGHEPNARKNVTAVIEAFGMHRAHREDTCHTDGETIWSYHLPIAKRLGANDVMVLDPKESPSRTTTSQIRAVLAEFPGARLVDRSGWWSGGHEPNARGEGEILIDMGDSIVSHSPGTMSLSDTTLTLGVPRRKRRVFAIRMGIDSRGIAMGGLHWVPLNSPLKAESEWLRLTGRHVQLAPDPHEHDPHEYEANAEKWGSVSYVPEVVETREEAHRLAMATGRRVRFTEDHGGAVQPPQHRMTRNAIRATPMGRESSQDHLSADDLQKMRVGDEITVPAPGGGELLMVKRMRRDEYFVRMHNERQPRGGTAAQMAAYIERALGVTS